MSLRIKRKRESLPEPPGTIVGDSNSMERGGHRDSGRKVRDSQEAQAQPPVKKPSLNG